MPIRRQERHRRLRSFLLAEHIARAKRGIVFDQMWPTILRHRSVAATAVSIVAFMLLLLLLLLIPGQWINPTANVAIDCLFWLSRMLLLILGQISDATAVVTKITLLLLLIDLSPTETKKVITFSQGSITTAGISMGCLQFRRVSRYKSKGAERSKRIPLSTTRYSGSKD